MKELIAVLKQNADTKYAEDSKRYFKTKKGEYAYGDIFIGIRVPILRKLIIPFKTIPLRDIEQLLHNPIHEMRFAALLLLVEKYNACKNLKEKEKIVNIYLKNTKYINNWDLVDCSAHKILGKFILENEFKNIEMLFNLAKSEYLFDRRIAIVSTLTFIDVNKLNYSLELSKRLLEDSEDLIKKATGWILREVYKKDNKLAIDFIKSNRRQMSNITFNYATEKIDKSLKRKLL